MDFVIGLKCDGSISGCCSCENHKENQYLMFNKVFYLVFIQYITLFCIFGAHFSYLKNDSITFIDERNMIFIYLIGFYS